MRVVSELFEVSNTQPEPYKDVAIFNKDFSDFKLAMYVVWYEGDGENEVHEWIDDNSVYENFEDYPFWCDGFIVEKQCAKQG